MDLPLHDHKYYAGIDPGFSGAIGMMNATGTWVEIHDMPVTEAPSQKQREINLGELLRIVYRIAALPDSVVGLEWPTTRPGEGAERSERFGRQKGYLEALLFASGIPTYKIAPNLWKGRLGLPGKTNPEARSLADTMFHTHYPEHGSLVRGSRGGLKDGRCDALLIAHFLRTRTVSAMRDTVERYGKDSPQALSMLYGHSRKTRKRNR